MSRLTDADIVRGFGAIGKQLIEARVETAVLKNVVAILAGKMGIDHAGLLDLIRQTEQEARERVLLSIGDTNPTVAGLFGSEEVLRQNESTPPASPPPSA